MLKRNLHEVTAADIEALVKDKVHENLRLDYKQNLPTATPAEWDEFCKDVSAFANTLGGDIILGIAEARDGHSPCSRPDGDFSKHGLAISNPGPEVDKIVNKLRDMDVISPRVQSIDCMPIDIGQGWVIVVRIPRSLAAPHMLTPKLKDRGLWQFYMRDTQSSSPMNVQQVRAAFDNSSGLVGRMNQFVDEQRMLFNADSPVTKLDIRCLTLFLLPTDCFEGQTQLTYAAMNKNCEPLRVTLDGTARSEFPNFDGMLLGVPDSGRYRAFTQLYRNGAIQAYSGDITSHVEGSQKLRLRDISNHSANVIHRALLYYKKLGIPPPIELRLKLMGVKGYTRFADRFEDPVPIMRDNLDFAPLVIEKLDLTFQEVGTALRPIFDVLWQACGKEGCPDFDTSGKWSPVSGATFVDTISSVS